MGEISQEEMERLLRRADFSAETDCKARLWDCLTELLALAQAEGMDLTQEEAEAYLAELSVLDLSDEEMQAVAGGLG